MVHFTNYFLYLLISRDGLNRFDNFSKNIFESGSFVDKAMKSGSPQAVDHFAIAFAVNIALEKFSVIPFGLKRPP